MPPSFPKLARLPEPSERNVTIRTVSSGQRALRKRHPWLFESGIREQSHEGRPGDLGVVFDQARKFLAIGLYDPHSPIRLRVLHAGRPKSIDAAFFAARFTELAARRAALAGTATDGYRLVHGDNEGLGGLVVDRYAETLVIKLYTSAWLPHLRTALPGLLEACPAERVVLRWGRDARARADEVYGLEDGTVIFGPELDGEIVFRENGLRFGCDPVHGQKTGFFLDQRDNRASVAELTRGSSVLNVFSYSGGFSLYAARGGARHVVSLDRSRPALEAAERNFALNQGDPAIVAAKHETLQGDAFECLRELDRARRGFDVVVIDPPAFAKRASEIQRALGAYAGLVERGLALVRPGGVLVMASCSARVAANDFFTLVHRVSAQAGRPLDEFRRSGAPLDHPVGFPEGAYLKCLFARVKS